MAINDHKAENVVVIAASLACAGAVVTGTETEETADAFHAVRFTSTVGEIATIDTEANEAFVEKFMLVGVVLLSTENQRPNYFSQAIKL